MRVSPANIRTNKVSPPLPLREQREAMKESRPGALKPALKEEQFWKREQRALREPFAEQKSR
jgi:hypothetical protein